MPRLHPRCAKARDEPSRDWELPLGIYALKPADGPPGTDCPAVRSAASLVAFLIFVFRLVR